MSTGRQLTPTSYALLGLLAVRPWSTYELARQMDRTVSRFWPRARSKVYEEPKKLVALGLARAAQDRVGRRARTLYSITPKGRRVLTAWVGVPGEGPVLEFEQLMKVFFADSGTTADIRLQLAATREWVHERTLVNVEVGRSYLEGSGPFPERAPVNLLVGRFLDDFLEAVDRWAAWAEQAIEGWPDDPLEAPVDLRLQAEAVDQAVARAARHRAAVPPS